MHNGPHTQTQRTQYQQEQILVRYSIAFHSPSQTTGTVTHIERDMKVARRTTAAEGSDAVLPPPQTNEVEDEQVAAAAVTEAVVEDHGEVEERDGGEEEEDEEDKGFGEEFGDDLEIRQEEDRVVEAPKLAEGFYEIESVRRKRTRKVSLSTNCFRIFFILCFLCSFFICFVTDIFVIFVVLIFWGLQKKGKVQFLIKW